MAGECFVGNGRLAERTTLQIQKRAPRPDFRRAFRLQEAVGGFMMNLDEMVDLCRRCHRLAPFTNYNGNTFSAIARVMIETLEIPRESMALARSLAGHIVAGVASDEEVRAFRKFCEDLG
jgi:hypothetical protein